MKVAKLRYNDKDAPDAVDKSLKETGFGVIVDHTIKSHLVEAVKDEWTEQNKILGPTLKIKRGNVEEMYSSKYRLWTANNSKIIWE
mgnify:CR=1 FL=1